MQILLFIWPCLYCCYLFIFKFQISAEFGASMNYCPDFVLYSHVLRFSSELSLVVSCVPFFFFFLMEVQVSTELAFILFIFVLSIQDVFYMLLNGCCGVGFNHSFYALLCNTSL